MKEIKVHIIGIGWDSEPVYTNKGTIHRNPTTAEIDCSIQVIRDGQHESRFRAVVEVPLEKTYSFDEAADYIKSLFF
ncbi:hypothetical protein [Pseudobacillus badius]|uniref:hypothetical protein n=1 Tax=Bacillus badius TaxID=1455 RepID=UPI0024A1E309|nr:hypothetical protein [Bacillus badius]GLY11406.1 hypothetical protein Bbad01_26220 [Bacillus badius]